MQGSRPKKSAILFDFLLEQQQLTQLVHTDESVLKKLILHSSKHFHKALVRDRGQVSLFLANYRQIMELHSRLIRSATSINISLHFALLFTHDLISQNHFSEAKAILKQTEEYLHLEECDSILLSACLNNLALLQLRGGRPKKALTSCLNGISIMEEHLEHLREMKNRRRMSEDGVIFVNLLLIAKRSLTRILKGHPIEAHTYRQLLKTINKLGYNFSNKYLGASSIFTLRFQPASDSISLPVYDSSTSEEEDLRNDFEMKLAEQLANIYNILRDMKLQPEVYYIKEHFVEPKESHEASIQVIEELPSMQPEPERNVALVEHIIVDQWNVELTILISKELAPQREFQFLGTLQFRLSKGRKSREKIVTQAIMHRIIYALNAYDILPYCLQLKRLNCQQFTKKVLLGFLDVNDEGELHIFPRAKPVIPPFQLTFCGERCFIMVNHVCFRRFRVAICPVGTTETVYLQLQFRHKQTESLFRVAQFQHEFISGCSKKYHPQDKFEEQYSYAPLKKIQILSPEFGTKINRILQEFQVYLTEEEESRMSEMTTLINFTEHFLYYQYTEFKDGIGQFHMLKYRSNANHIQVSCKNLFPTYSPNGQEYARGSTTYSPQQFLRDFAVPMKATKRHIPALCEIILQKFSLKIYSNPLQEKEQDLYEQNAIVEVPITSKCFSRRFLAFEDYQIPVTIQVVAVNNEKPIGIRITAYEPLKGAHSGLFIHIVQEYWERPLNKEEVGKAEQEGGGQVKKSTEDYNFKKCYFLTTWMEQEGFQLIFDRLEIVNRALELRGTTSKFVRLDEILRKSNIPE